MSGISQTTRMLARSKLAKKIKLRRKRGEMSRYELAKIIGVSERQVIRWEKCESTPSNLACIQLRLLDLVKRKG